MDYDRKKWTNTKKDTLLILQSYVFVQKYNYEKKDQVCFEGVKLW